MVHTDLLISMVSEKKLILLFSLVPTHTGQWSGADRAHPPAARPGPGARRSDGPLLPLPPPPPWQSLLNSGNSRPPLRSLVGHQANQSIPSSILHSPSSILSRPRSHLFRHRRYRLSLCRRPPPRRAARVARRHPGAGAVLPDVAHEPARRPGAVAHSRRSRAGSRRGRAHRPGAVRLWHQRHHR